MSSSYGRPILIGTGSDAQILEAVPLQKDGAREYSEDWLQNLLFRYPEALVRLIDRSRV